MNTALTVAVFGLLGGVLLVRLPTVLRDAKQRALWATCFTLAVCNSSATACRTFSQRSSRFGATARANRWRSSRE